MTKERKFCGDFFHGKFATHTNFLRKSTHETMKWWDDNEMQILIKFHLLYSRRCLIVSKSRCTSVKALSDLKHTQFTSPYPLDFTFFWINFILKRRDMRNILNFLFLYCLVKISTTIERRGGWNEKYVTRGRFVISKSIYSNDGWHLERVVESWKWLKIENL
jgi:hypothetical protein